MTLSQFGPEKLLPVADYSEKSLDPVFDPPDPAS